MTTGHFDRIEIGKLKVHPKGQRTLKRWRVALIASNWDWEAMKPVIIVPMADGSGGYWIVDGQHTVTACRARFSDFDGTLPCWVLPTRSDKEIAKLFLLHNDLQRPSNPADKYNGKLNAHDPAALKTEAALNKVGIRTIYGDEKLGDNETRCGYAFLRALEEVGADGLDIVIRCVKSCQNNGAVDPLALRAKFIGGATEFAKRGKLPKGILTAEAVLQASGHGVTSAGYRRSKAIADVLESVCT